MSDVQGAQRALWRAMVEWLRSDKPAYSTLPAFADYEAAVREQTLCDLGCYWVDLVGPGDCREQNIEGPCPPCSARARRDAAGVMA